MNEQLNRPAIFLAGNQIVANRVQRPNTIFSIRRIFDLKGGGERLDKLRVAGILERFC